MKWPLTADELKKWQLRTVQMAVTQAEKAGRSIFSSASPAAYSHYRRVFLSAATGIALCSWLIILILRQFNSENPVRLISWVYAVLAFITGGGLVAYAWKISRQSTGRFSRRKRKSDRTNERG